MKPGDVHPEDLLLDCHTCDYAASGTRFEHARLTAAGDQHHAQTGHELALGRLIDHEYEWTETGEILNGYEMALRLLARRSQP